MSKITQGRFEWDSEKDKINVKKHKISFSEILEVFDDPYFLELFDDKHSTLEEKRIIGIGSLRGIAIILTVFTERDRIRIISARKATKKEEVIYYEQKNIID